jgi:hypothetical protein
MALDDQLTPDQLDEMIGEIDTDGSGTVDFEGKSVLQCASVPIFIVRSVWVGDCITSCDRRVVLRPRDKTKSNEGSSITHLFVHSFIGLFYDRSTASSKANSPQSVTQCLLYQLPVSCPFFKSSSSCLLLLVRLFTASVLILYISFNNLF